MADFKVDNTAVADRLAAPVYSAQFLPIITSPVVPGQVQFSNFVVESAFFRQVGSVVSLGVIFTADVYAPTGGSTGQMFMSAPVPRARAPYSAGAILSRVGGFGNIDIADSTTIALDMLNPGGGVISPPVNTEFEVIASYMVIS